MSDMPTAHRWIISPTLRRKIDEMIQHTNGRPVTLADVDAVLELLKPCPAGVYHVHVPCRHGDDEATDG